MLGFKLKHVSKRGNSSNNIGSNPVYCGYSTQRANYFSSFEQYERKVLDYNFRAILIMNTLGPFYLHNLTDIMTCVSNQTRVLWDINYPYTAFNGRFNDG